jgi:protein-S-isoprenylcysteine O-methyltransferase Ste14
MHAANVRSNVYLPLMELFLLFTGWLSFGFLHSFLAAISVKNKLSAFAGKYYRFYYSVLATLHLGIVLYYQFSISAAFLFEPQYWSIPLLLIGAVFMLVSIEKYFFYLSGIDVFMNRPVDARLETSGLHQYVRHPLYFGTLLVVWSLWLMMPSLAHLVGVGMMTVYTVIGTIIEEKKLLKEYGQQYADYQSKVPMLIPFKRFFISSETSGKQERVH